MCTIFRELLSNPSPGDAVWDVLELSDPVFEGITLCELNRQAYFASPQADLQGQISVSFIPWTL